MIKTWPSYAFVNGNTIKERRVDNYRRDEYESGPIRQQKVDCKPMYELTFKVQVCVDVYDDFLSWFNDDICQGMRKFKMVCPIRGEEFVYRFVGNELNFTFVPQNLMEATVTLERW